jgi:thioredoxin-like negative regulator of GroEL
VVEGGPAAKARLQDGDLIRAIDGKEVRNFEQLEKVMSALRAEQQVTIEVLRAGKDRRHGLQLGSRPGAAPRAESERPRPVKNPEPSKPKPKPVAEPKRVVEGSKSAPIAAVPTQRFSTDYDGGMQQARRASRPVVVVFGASWCPNCATLKKALEHPSLQRALARYERIWVDTDRHSALADRYGVEDLPHLVLLDAKGEQRKTLIGYQPPQILLTHLQKGPATGGAAGPGNPAAKSDARAEERAVAGQKAAARRAAAAKKAAAKKAAATNPAAPVAPRPERVARRAAAGAGAQQQARELARLRTEVQSLRREQRQQRELLQQILKELQQRK